MTPNFPYYNAVDQIFHAEWSIARLARQEFLRHSIARLWPDGHPTRFVNVTGTGGKGSTCRFLELGFSTIGNAGAFMSPHLFDYSERFSINGQFARHEDIVEAWETRVRPLCIERALENEQHVHTYLQSTLLIALVLFEQYDVQWAAIEAFLGGRYDYTRALDVEATLLTNVGSDHAHLLGKEQWQRAMDKAGIARRGVPFFTTEEQPETLTVIEAICQHEGAIFHQIPASNVRRLEEQVAEILNQDIPAESLLSAIYQRRNATLALTTLKHICPGIDEQVVLRQFVDARLLGRFWKVDDRIYADIAHNVEKVRALASEIQSKFAEDEKILIVGASRHRIPKEIFAALADVARFIIVTGASFKGQDPHAVQRELREVAKSTPSLVIADPKHALQTAKSMQTEKDIIVLTGSTYMIEQVLNPDEYMRYLNSSFGWRVEERNEAKGTVQLMMPSVPPPLR